MSLSVRAEILLLVVVLFAASLWLNVVQWKRAITAPLREQVNDMGKALDDSATLLSRSRERAALLEAASERATARLANAGRAYDDAAKTRPLTDPKCAPGPGRVGAINQALGAKPPESR